MRLGRALFEHMAGAELDDEPDDFADALDWFVDEHDGNVSAAARSAGVSRTTFRRWLAGGSTSAGRSSSILAGARAGFRVSGLDVSGDLSGLRITATLFYAGGGVVKGSEDRDLPIGDYLDAWVGDALIEAYLDGAGPDELERLFAAGVNDNGGFYESTFAGGGLHSDMVWDVAAIEGWS